MTSTIQASTMEKMPVLVLNPHNRCNCRCVMCDIWKRTAAEEIGAAQLEARMESIERLGVEWVVFTGGEPLMHSDLFQLCVPFRRRGIRQTLLSSGLLLERHHRQIVDNVDDVIVSLDGPAAIHDRIRRVDGAFARLRAGVDAIRHLRPDFPIAARCTVQRDNAAFLVETVRAARELGLTSISFLAADLTSTAFDRRPDSPPDIVPEESVLTEQVEQLIASGDCSNFILESAAKLRRIVSHFHGGHTAPACNAPWVSSVMEADGTIRPCFFHKPIGRVDADHTLLAVINGPPAVAFRASLDVATNPICSRCVCSLNWQPVNTRPGQ